MKVLGIETSCDETAAAVVQDGRRLLSNIVASSLELHKLHGGVVPEIAARSHLEAILPVIEEALAQAQTDWPDIDVIAVTKGPGLVGSLLIGVLAARTLAITKNIPLIGLNHVEAHFYANFLTATSLPGYHLPAKAPVFPALALIVSGGHTQLMHFRGHGDYRVIGQTADDALGEAFDKVAKLLGLPYPGGISVAVAAEAGDPQAFKLPRAQMSHPYDFSFSGLKTAVLRAAQATIGETYTFPSAGLPGRLNRSQKADLAASFQSVALSTVVDTLARAVAEFKPKSVVIGGGVAAHQGLRRLAEATLPRPPIYTDPKLCTDNGAMIAALGFYRSKSPSDPYKLTVEP